ncbi:MAG: ATP-binding protein, partial [Gemmatimonadales bacterium]
ELGHCLEQILDAAMRLTGADKGNIQRFDDRTGMIRLVAQRGFDPAFCEFFAEVAGSDPSACGAAMRNGLRTVVDDVRTSPVFAGSAAREVVLAAGVRAVQSTPLISSTGDVIGMISTHWAEPGRPDERQLRWIDLLARQAADYLERTAREEELRRLNEELRERDRRKDEFLATLAHELRNPLAPIRSAVQALLLRHDAGAEAEWFHGVIERQVSHMSRLVDDLLDVSRMRHGKLEVRRERLDLSEIIFHAVEANRPHLESGRFDFEMALPDEPLMVEADPVRLAQVFGNLLHNATKFTPPGGRIRITAVLEDYRVAVSVRDSGIGLDPALVPRLFALFSQGSAAAGRMQEGLGVGLYLVGALVTLHGGTVDVRSEGPGMGTEFLVRLPLATARRPTPVPSQVAQPAVPARGKRRRVLVADDLRDGADTLAMLLEAMGHEAYPVYGGREALQLAEQLRPDLLFLDLGMPEMDGWEVCEQLRRAPWGRGLTVVALTGRGQDTDIGATLEAGFDRHLVKPVRRETLLEVLGSLPARG